MIFILQGIFNDGSTVRFLGPSEGVDTPSWARLNLRIARKCVCFFFARIEFEPGPAERDAVASPVALPPVLNPRRSINACCVTDVTAQFNIYIYSCVIFCPESMQFKICCINMSSIHAIRHACYITACSKLTQFNMPVSLPTIVNPHNLMYVGKKQKNMRSNLLPPVFLRCKANAYK